LKKGNKQAGVAELVDVLDLGSSAARRGGSIPSARTNYKGMTGRQIPVFSENGLLRSKTRQMPSGHRFEGIFIFSINLKGTYQISQATHGSFVRKKFTYISLSQSNANQG
jgi:hypothetical protein